MDAELESVAKQASELSQRVMMSLGGRGDRAPYWLHASATFMATQSNIQKLTFNVPADADFHGDRLNLYLQYRILDTTSAATTDTAFRPARWASQADPGSVFDNLESNAVVALKDDGNGLYQNAPFSVACLFSSMYGVMNGSQGAAVSLYTGGLDFFVPYTIGRGQAAELDVTPQFSTASQYTTITTYLTTNQTLEFKLVGIFRGHKVVRAFQ